MVIRDSCCRKALPLAERLTEKTSIFPAGSLLLLKAGIDTFFRDIDLMSPISDYDRNSKAFDILLSRQCIPISHRWKAYSCYSCPIELIPVPDFLYEEFKRLPHVEFWIGTNLAKMSRWGHEFAKAKFITKLFIVIRAKGIDNIDFRLIREHLEIQRKVGYYTGRVLLPLRAFRVGYYFYRYVYIDAHTRFVEAAYEEELEEFSKVIRSFLSRLQSAGIEVVIED